VHLDATNLAPFGDGAIDLIECHHMIEHLSFRDTERALREWSRVVKSGGLLILTFPDLAAIARAYLKYSALYRLLPRPARIDHLVSMLVGSQEHEGMFHRNAFDRGRITRLLGSHGFAVEFTYCRYPRRATPSRLVIARRV
jgi:predicted SAM-dependent methyltransferase